MPGAHKELGRVPVPTKPEKKDLRIHGALRSVLRKVTTLVVVLNRAWTIDYRLLRTCLRMLKSMPQKDQTDANQLNYIPEQSPKRFKEIQKKSSSQQCKIHTVWHSIKNYQAQQYKLQLEKYKLI